MTRQSPDAEQALERATMALFDQLRWTTVDAYYETFGETPTNAKTAPCLGRATRHEVVLRPRLRAALAKLNPALPPEALHAAVEELIRERAAMGMARANREIYQMVKDGVPVTFQGEDGSERNERVRVIDWDDPTENEFLLVQQMWVSGELYTRRADLVGFVNGLPLLFGELKAHHRRLEHAYRDNLSDYKDTIPHLLWYNAVILLSNGSDAVMGTVTSEWEHFSPWKKINDEGEQGVVRLDTLIRGTCPRARFLDIVENYLLYQERRGGLAKIAAKYHQYFGVEKSIAAVRGMGDRRGRLGVFWHTQGSGKSLSMVFFSQKVLRKLPGNWTFVVITDRVDLDDQIYKNFARAGVVTEPEEAVRSQSGEHLKQLLREDHRYVFTLIHKFHAPQGQLYEKLSDRPDIIVMADEAHRSQYDELAHNMRRALPNAAFIAFTATPLMKEEEQETRDVFGDYVSVYTYKQSVEDGATVPLFYENRIPEVQLVNWALNDDVVRALEDAELDDAKEEAVAQMFHDQYEIITRKKRLERVADDIVDHFINRGFLGKAMVVSIDKLTAVKMYDKVQTRWQATLAELRAELATASADAREALAEQIAFMEETDMAVVVSQEQNEVAKFKKAGLDITPHRRRMVTEKDLDEKFKDPNHPFRLVFVCAMWRTGFDAPACSTIYLDRPMRNHTLMQTIARANRVFGAKVNGLIVDYAGIFHDLQKALAIYGTGPGGQMEEGEEPVGDKAELVEALREAIATADGFCAERGVEVGPIIAAEGLGRIALMDAAVERLVANDQMKAQYLGLAGRVNQLFKAVLPDLQAGEFSAGRNVHVVLAAKIRALSPEVDIAELKREIEGLLDLSVEVKEYVISGAGQVYDLSKIDFDALRQRFAQGGQHTEVEKLRGAVDAKLQQMVQRNPTRMNYRDEFQALIEEYNAGSRNIEEMFIAVVDLVQRMNEEEQRAIAEQLSEEELAVFDLLVKQGPALSESERRQVKRAVRDLLAKLKAEKLVLDWREREYPRAAVRVTIRDVLWDELPDPYTEAACEKLIGEVFLHIYDKYQSATQSVYAQAA